MEEGVAAPVRRIDAAAQIVPVADRVHRLVADDLFQDVRRRRPVDPAQHQEAAVEPGREQMDEVGVDGARSSRRTMRVEQLLAHAHQRRGAAGREVEPAQQLLPARLGRRVQLGGGRRRTGLAPGLDRRPRAAARSGPKRDGQRLEEGDARRRSSARRSGRGFRRASATPEASPRPGQQLLAELDQTLRALLRRPRAGRAVAVDAARGRARRCVCSMSPKKEVFTGALRRWPARRHRRT